MENRKDEKVEVIASSEKYIKFVKPTIFDNQTYDGISLNLNGLTGADLEKAEIQFINENPQIAAQTPLKEMSKGFLALVAAIAAKKPVEFFRKLSAADYAKVTTTVMTFLMSGDSDVNPQNK